MYAPGTCGKLPLRARVSSKKSFFRIDVFIDFSFILALFLAPISMFFHVFCVPFSRTIFAWIFLYFWEAFRMGEKSATRVLLHETYGLNTFSLLRKLVFLINVMSILS